MFEDVASDASGLPTVRMTLSMLDYNATHSINKRIDESPGFGGTSVAGAPHAALPSLPCSKCLDVRPPFA